METAVETVKLSDLTPGSTVVLAGPEEGKDYQGNYNVEIPEHKGFLVVMGGACYPKAGTRFDHPNLAAAADKVFETRAYWPDGRKKWYCHAGRDFYFVVPVERIELVKNDRGYSYIPALIDGTPYRFSVSGGTHNGWTDWLRVQVHTHIDYSQKKLRKLAESALPPAECKERGFGFDLFEYDRKDDFKGVLAPFLCRKAAKKDLEVHLGYGYKYGEKSGPFYLTDPEERKRRSWLLEDKNHQGSTWTPSRVRATWNQIDWKKTAEANGIEVPEATTINRVGAVKPREEDD